MDDHVWHLLTAPGTSFVRVFSKPTEQGAQPLGRKIESLADWRRMQPPPKYNTYVHLNPTLPVRRLRATAYDAAKWAFLLIDMDPKGDAIPEQSDVLHAIQLLQDRLTAEIHPDFGKAAVIYSGRGAQLWVRLHPTIITPGDTKTVDMIGNACNRFLTGIATWAPPGYRVDTTGDLARIARLPGSRNQKSGRKARIIDEGEVARAELSNVLLSYYRPFEPSHTTCGLDADFGTLDWRDVQDRLTLRAKNFIWMGEEEGERHASMQHAAKTMWELGVLPTSAIEALKMGAEASRPALTMRDVAAVMKQVYAKPGRPSCTSPCGCPRPS